MKLAVGFGFLLAVGAAEAQVVDVTALSRQPGFIGPGGEFWERGQPQTFGASPNGRYVAWWSGQPNVVANDAWDTWDLFLKDRVTGAVQRVNISDLGPRPLGKRDLAYTKVFVSGEGRYVAFEWDPLSLPGGGAPTYGVYLRDVAGGFNKLISLTDTGERIASPRLLTMDSAGQYVVYKDLTSGKQYLYERASDSHMRFELHFGALPTDPPLEFVAMSNDGVSGVIKTTLALTADDTDGLADFYLLSPLVANGKRRLPKFEAVHAVANCTPYVTGSTAAKMAADDYNERTDPYLYNPVLETWTLVARDGAGNAFARGAEFRASDSSGLNQVFQPIAPASNPERTKLRRISAGITQELEPLQGAAYHLNDQVSEVLTSEFGDVDGRIRDIYGWRIGTTRMEYVSRGKLPTLARAATSEITADGRLVFYLGQDFGVQYATVKVHDRTTGEVKPALKINDRQVLYIEDFRVDRLGRFVVLTTKDPAITKAAWPQVVLYDRKYNTWELLTSGARETARGPVRGLSIAGNGQQIAFSMVDGTGLEQAYYFERQRNRLLRVSQVAGVAGNGHSMAGMISFSGNRIAFSSRATNLGGSGNPEDATRERLFFYDTATYTLHPALPQVTLAGSDLLVSPDGARIYFPRHFVDSERILHEWVVGASTPTAITFNGNTDEAFLRGISPDGRYLAVDLVYGDYGPVVLDTQTKHRAYLWPYDAKWRDSGRIGSRFSFAKDEPVMSFIRYSPVVARFTVP